MMVSISFLLSVLLSQNLIFVHLLGLETLFSGKINTFSWIYWGLLTGISLVFYLFAIMFYYFLWYYSLSFLMVFVWTFFVFLLHLLLHSFEKSSLYTNVEPLRVLRFVLTHSTIPLGIVCYSLFATMGSLWTGILWILLLSLSSLMALLAWSSLDRILSYRISSLKNSLGRQLIIAFFISLVFASFHLLLEEVIYGFSLNS